MSIFDIITQIVIWATTIILILVVIIICIFSVSAVFYFCNDKKIIKENWGNTWSSRFIFIIKLIPIILIGLIIGLIISLLFLALFTVVLGGDSELLHRY